MSSIDQAFVKAFARRSRPTRDASQTDTVTTDPLKQDVGKPHVDPSVAPTAKVWIDPINDQVLRTEAAAEMTVPDPHHKLATTPIKPSEHFRCDYVFGAVKEVLPAQGEGELKSIDELESVDAKIADTEIDAESVAPEFEAESAAHEIEAESAAPEIEAEFGAPEIETVTTDTEISAADDHVEIAPADNFLTDSDTTTIEAEETSESNSDASEANAKPQPKEIDAAWEVDLFEVPSTTADLFFDEDFFQGIANHMRNAVENGLRSLVVTSAQTGEGRSTVAIGMAIAAAASGLKVALVDGDTEDPTLADDLRLDLECGWVDTIRSGLPIDQVAVQSIQDGVALFPLIPSTSSTQSATAVEVEQLMQTLADRFDLIVVDGPTCAMPRIQQFAALVDTAIITRDASRTDAETINELSDRLKESGVKGVGVVENFS